MHDGSGDRWLADGNEDSEEPTLTKVEAPALREAIRSEAGRIHESAIFSAQGQLEAGKGWRTLHWSLGALTAGLSTASAVITFASGVQLLSGVLAVLSAIAVTVLTGARPDKLSEQAHGLGNGYLALRNDARRLRDVACLVDPLPELREALDELARRVIELNYAADAIPRWAYLLSKRNIEKDGGQRFEEDQK